MTKIIIKNARIVNEGKITEGDLLVKNDRIERVGGIIESNSAKEINAGGNYLLPGVIDDQVHFREPGMEYKATVFTESRAAVAGGVTSFMDMPNTKPASLSQELLEKRYENAAKNSAANYSFYMGASNDNIEEVLKTDPKNVCGVKIFMGSSTGNMLVDEPSVLEGIFSKSPMLIATHCEDETTVKNNHHRFLEKYGDQLTPIYHPQIRSEEACYLSSSFAVGLAKKHGTRLHVLHLTTAREMELFSNELALENKRITAEVCVHHLFFNDSDYATLGNRLKCNPAVKTKNDQDALLKALLENKIDVVATDHAPHSKEEKAKIYAEAPAGLPLVQHSLTAMMELVKKGKISLERVVEKMSHAPAITFRIAERGFLREGYFADMVLLDPNNPFKVEANNIRYKCGWSPFENYTFSSKVTRTMVNGQLVFENDQILEVGAQKRLKFNN